MANPSGHEGGLGPQHRQVLASLRGTRGRADRDFIREYFKLLRAEPVGVGAGMPQGASHDASAHPGGFGAVPSTPGALAA